MLYEVITNAGLPRNVNGEFLYDLGVPDYVRSMRGFIEKDGIAMVGGCCGTTPEYIAALNAILPSLKPARLEEAPGAESVSSLFTAQSLTQSPPPFFIGERTNTNGSKLFRETLLVITSYSIHYTKLYEL